MMFSILNVSICFSAQACGTQNIFISQEDASFSICFEKYTLLFIYPSFAAASKLRQQCRLHTTGPMAYDLYSKGKTPSPENADPMLAEC